MLDHFQRIFFYLFGLNCILGTLLPSVLQPSVECKRRSCTLFKVKLFKTDERRNRKKSNKNLTRDLKDSVDPVFQCAHLSIYVCICFNKSLHLFPIFPAKYKERRSGSRLNKVKKHTISVKLFLSFFRVQN